MNYSRSLCHLFVILLFTFSINAFAVTDKSGMTKVVFEKKMAQLNEELVSLNKLQQAVKGQDKLALRLQLYQINKNIRSLIQEGIDSEHINKAYIFPYVRQQVEFNQQGLDYLSQRSADISEELNSAKNEDKFSLLIKYEDARKYLDNMYTEATQNYIWRKKLGDISKTEEDEIKLKVTNRIEQLSANIQYLQQKLKADETQLALAPESERVSIQLDMLMVEKRLEIATASLKALVKTADQLNISSTEYKRLYFEATGSITEYLVNPDVIYSIVSTWVNRLWFWVIEKGPQHILQLLAFAFILLIARIMSSITRKVVKRGVSNAKLDFSNLMKDFFVSISGKVVWVIGVMVGLSQIGIDLTPILTGFGIAGLVVGFALQDSLSNFASGMMLLIYRPFDVGDYVLAGGVEGKVSHMSLVNTTIKTFDNQIIIVPNSKIWREVIKNVTHERLRRVDMKFAIAYQEDVEFVERVFLDIITSHPLVLSTPEPMIKVHALSTYAVDYIVRPWVKTDDYWDVYWDVTRAVKIRLQQEGIVIPYPQQDINLFNAGQPVQLKQTFSPKSSEQSDDA